MLVWLFKGALLLKKGLASFFGVAKKPTIWLISAIFGPVATILYGLYRTVRRVLVVSGLHGRRLTSCFNHHYAIRGGVIVIAFLVTASNLHASEQLTSDDDLGGDQSILASTMDSFEDEVLVEEFGSASVFPGDSSYLGSQAITADEFSSPEYVEEEAVESDMGIYAVEANGAEFETPAVPAMPTRSEVTTHIVQAGETVQSIASAYGLSVGTILTANGLNSRGLIRVGQELRIPPVDGILYKTKKGDTLAKIAKTYDSDVMKIIEANGFADDAVLAVDQEIILPGGRMPAAPKPVVKRTTSSGSSAYDSSPAPSGSADRIGSGKLLWPIGCRRISQYFKGRRHTGLDIACPMRTPIYASDDGTVIFSGWNSGGYGNMILIDHGNGLMTRYAHATKLYVKVGEHVTRGDTIALEGSTGRSTGPHIHYEVLKGSTRNWQNPLDYIK